MLDAYVRPDSWPLNLLHFIPLSAISTIGTAIAGKLHFSSIFPPSLPDLLVLLHPWFTHPFHSPLSLSPLNSARRSEGEVRYKLTKVPSEKCQPVSKVGGIRVMHLVPTISKTGGDASHWSERVAAPMISTRPKGRVWAVMVAALCCIVYDKSINQSLIY